MIRGGRVGTDEALVSIEDAQALVLGACSALAPRRIPCTELLGHVLAEAVLAPVALPRFTHAAMDGYALRAADVREVPTCLVLAGSVMAGEEPTAAIAPGEAVRIMTGAPLPVGADAVCVIERTRANADGTVLVEQSVPSGANIRAQGEDVALGDEVFSPGATLGPAHLGVLASLGITEVLAHPLPRVGVLSTGDELAVGPEPIGAGKIRDANRPSLLAQLTRDGYPVRDLGTVRDDLGALVTALAAAGACCDAVIVSGGVSVGDRDFVADALGEIGRDRLVTMQVAVRPARPFALGSFPRTGAPLFGVPGNPVAALVSYELLVRPGLRALSGESHLWRARLPAVCDTTFARRSDGKVHLVRVHAVLGSDGAIHVRPSGGQGSHMLRALADANALAVVPDGEGVGAGERLEILVLDADRLTGE